MSGRLGPYALGRRLRLHAPLASLEFHEAERGGTPCLLVVAREDIPSFPDFGEWRRAFDADVAALLLLRGLLQPLGRGELEGRPYLALTTPLGPTLDAFRRSPVGPRLPAGLALAAAAQLGESLGAAQEAGVELPLQPDTLFLSRDGRVRLLPPLWHVWELEMPSFDLPPIELGLPPAEPGDAGRALVFRLGTVLVELLAGAHPLQGRAPREWGAVLRGELPPPSSLAPELAPLDEVVARCTHPDPARRYASPHEAAEALGELLGRLRGTNPHEALAAQSRALGRLAAAAEGSDA